MSLSTWKLVKRFSVIAGFVLVLTGLAKLDAVFREGGDILDLTDPLFGISFRILFFIVAVVELIIGGYCLLCNNKTAALSGVALITSMFLFYRISIFLLGWQKPCGCMGSFGRLFDLDDAQLNVISLSLLAFLLCGSWLLLIMDFKKKLIFHKIK